MSWSLFKITAVDSKPVVVELRRIADTLDAYMSLVHGYNMTPPKPLASNTASEVEEPTVGYATDEQTALAELLEEFEQLQGKHNSEEEQDQ